MGHTLSFNTSGHNGILTHHIEQDCKPEGNRETGNSLAALSRARV